METLIGRPRKARKHVAEELEKKADLAFLERIKKRKTPIGKGIPWQTVKKNLGLQRRAFSGCHQAAEKAGR